MSGFDELNRIAADLRKASVTAQYRAARVVAKAAFDVESTAKGFAPVDTGFLRSSIGVDLNGTSAVIGPTAEYAPYVEFGTSRMAPQAFMGPALDRVSPSFVAAIEQLGGDVL